MIIKQRQYWNVWKYNFVLYGVSVGVGLSNFWNTYISSVWEQGDENNIQK